MLVSGSPRHPTLLFTLRSGGNTTLGLLCACFNNIGIYFISYVLKEDSVIQRKIQLTENIFSNNLIKKE